MTSPRARRSRAGCSTTTSGANAASCTPWSSTRRSRSSPPPSPIPRSPRPTSCAPLDRRYLDYVAAHPHGYRAIFRGVVSADERVRELVDANLRRQEARIVDALTGGRPASAELRLAVHAGSRSSSRSSSSGSTTTPSSATRWRSSGCEHSTRYSCSGAAATHHADAGRRGPRTRASARTPASAPRTGSSANAPAGRLARSVWIWRADP